MKNYPNTMKQIILFFVMSIIVMVSITNSGLSTSYARKEFVINNNTQVFLDITSKTYYNGSITITVTTGVGINATVNGVIKEVLLSEQQIFLIQNVNSIYFEITSKGYSEGYFELELNININLNGKNPITTTVGILMIIMLLLSVVVYYIRTKKLETKPEEEEEQLNPDIVRRRKEASGAEKKYLGLDDEI